METTPWYVYALQSQARKITYVGCTTDVARRLRQHNGDAAGGGKFTARWRPWFVVCVYGPYANRSEALRAELRVKRLRGPARFSATEPRYSPGG